MFPAVPEIVNTAFDPEQIGLFEVSVGALGEAGCELTTTFTDDVDVQPAAFVTVYVYVPAAKPEIVVVIPVPVVVTAPGLLVKVHVPLDGNPFKTTLPVAVEQVGCVIVPIAGAAGVTG